MAACSTRFTSLAANKADPLMNASINEHEGGNDPPHVAPVGHLIHPALSGFPLTTLADGLVFESILGELGVKPERVVISLPNEALSNPALLVRSILSYRNRGYGVMIHVNSITDPGLGRLFLAEPHYVQADMPPAESAALAGKMLHSLKRAGFRVVARKVETGQQAELAREIGFDLIHGFHIGLPRTTLAREAA